MTVDTAELRRLLAAATPGPWTVVREEPQLDTTDSGAKAWVEIGNVETAEMVADCTPNFRDHPSSWEGASWSEADEQAQADAALIVACVNALPVLLDRLDDAARQLNEAIQHLAIAEECMRRDRNLIHGVRMATSLAEAQSLARASEQKPKAHALPGEPARDVLASYVDDADDAAPKSALLDRLDAYQEVPNAIQEARHSAEIHTAQCASEGDWDLEAYYRAKAEGLAEAEKIARAALDTEQPSQRDHLRALTRESQELPGGYR